MTADVFDDPRLTMDAEWRAERYDRELGRLDAIDARYRDAITDLEPVQAWAEGVLLGSDRWLLLQGPTGTGKTHQAYAAMRIVIAAGGGINPQGDVEAELLGRIRRLWPSEAAEELIATYATCPLLVIDDLGAAKSSEWTEEVLYRVLNRRYAALLPCLLTSNLPTKNLRDQLGDRLASRIAEAADVVVLTGPDRRRA